MVRTGAQYIASLRDDRTVYVNGERVADVTEHPAFHGAVRSIAHLYDLAASPEYGPDSECVPARRQAVSGRRRMKAAV